LKENVIVIMVRSNSEDIVLLNRCFKSLENTLNLTLQDSDIILFVENDFSKFESQVDLPSSFKNNLKYVNIDLSVPVQVKQKFVIPEYFPHPTHSYAPDGKKIIGFPLSYRSMCRFFSGIFYTHESLLDYKNYIRLDTDSYFLKGANLSLFDWFNAGKLVYGYIESAVQDDHPQVVVGLRDTVRQYMRLRLRSRRLVPHYIGIRSYYTNFEIGSLDFFRSPVWQDFFQFLDSTGGFYTQRWGDAPVRFAGIWATCPKKQISKIPPGFTYFHGDYFNS